MVWTISFVCIAGQMWACILSREGSGRTQFPATWMIQREPNTKEKCLADAQHEAKMRALNPTLWEIHCDLVPALNTKN